MSFFGNNGYNNYSNGYNGYNGNGNGNGTQGASLVRHISEFIGETVTIFTTSGGMSGCGFTGVVLSVNPCFVRLVTEQGMAPTNPLSENICGDFDNGGRDCGGPGGPGGPGGMGGMGGMGKGRPNGNGHGRVTGSVCDIPVDRIAAFCHNAV
jgi:hypothetical protein